MRLRNESTPWVERETLVEAAPDAVWAALTDEYRLAESIAPEVELDPIEGGEIAVRDSDDERAGTVETLEEEHLAFTWCRPGQGERYVEFTLEPLPAGTRVTVVTTPIGPTGIAPGGSSARLVQLHSSPRLAPVA